MDNEQIVAQRKRHGIRPLDDVILDTIRKAVAKAGSVYSAAPLLGITTITVHKRLQDGYSDGRKPVVTDIIDGRNKRICNYDWTACDKAKK